MIERLRHGSELLFGRRGSLARRALTQIGVRIGLGVLAITVVAFWITWSERRADAVGFLQRYVETRSEIEGDLFSEARLSAGNLASNFASRMLQVGKEDPAREFNSKFERFYDGAIRVKTERDDHREMATVFVQPDSTVSDDLQRRVLVAHRLVGEFGPAGRGRFGSTFVYLTEGAAIVYATDYNASYALPVDTQLVTQPVLAAASPGRNPLREPVVTPAYFNDIVNEWRVSVVVPIYSGGQWVGVAGHEVRIHGFLRRATTRRLEGAHNVIFTGAGQLLAHPQFAQEIHEGRGGYRVDQTSDVGLRELWQRVLQHRTGLTTFTSDNGDWIYVAAPIAGLDWYFATAYPSSRLTAAAMYTSGWVLLLGLVVLVAEFVLLAWVLRRRVEAPLQTFVVATEQLASGQAASRVPAVGDDEVARLGRAFNAMADAVVAARSDLESQVASRTAELARAKAEQEVMLESTLVGIAYVIERRCIWVNQRLCDMVGHTPDELIGHSTILLFADPAVWEAIGGRAYDTIARGERASEQVEYLHAEHGRFWVEISGCAVEPGRPERGVIWTVLDINERRKAEVEIRQALAKQQELNGLKSRFVAMTSHEFRTPLATILSSVELLRDYDQQLDPDTRRGLYLQTTEAVSRMTELLEQVLLIGKADAGRLEFQPRWEDLDRFCQALFDEIGDAARRRDPGREFEQSYEFRGEPVAVVDPKLLRHILGNLLSNAFKYSPQGGRVSLTVRHGRSAIEFTVADQGIGIPPEDLPHLFDTFHRASNVGDISGTGLGLAIVKKSVDLYRGMISVDSHVGLGTRFVVSLPDGRTGPGGLIGAETLGEGIA